MKMLRIKNMLEFRSNESILPEGLSYRITTPGPAPTVGSQFNDIVPKIHVSPFIKGRKKNLKISYAQRNIFS